MIGWGVQGGRACSYGNAGPPWKPGRRRRTVRILVKGKLRDVHILGNGPPSPMTIVAIEAMARKMMDRSRLTL